MAQVTVDVQASNAANPETPLSVGLVAVVNPDGSPIAAGGGGGGETSNGLTDAQLRASPVPVSGPLTDAQLRAAAVPVSGPITNAQFIAVTGAANAAAWDGAAPSATLIQILKSIHAQLILMNTLLGEIDQNTQPAP